MTNEERSEGALLADLAMYEDLLSNVPNGIYRFRMKASGGWGFDFVSSRFCELTGLDRAEILNDFEAVFRLIHRDDLKEFLSLNKSVEKTLSPFKWEGRAKIQEETRWVKVEARATRMDNGDIVWRGHFADITDRKRTENELRERERVWTTLLNNLPGFVYRCANDRDWTMDYISHGCIEVTGYDPENFIGNRNLAYNDIVHPDYAEPLWNRWQQVIASRGVFEEEYPIIAKGGVIRWVWERGQGIFSDDGRFLFLEGFITEITNRKRIEEELRRRKEELTTVLDALPAMVWIGHDPHCQVITGNRLVNQLFEVLDETNLSQTAAEKGQAIYLKHFKADGTEFRPDELPMQKAVATGQRIFDQEIEYALPDGRRVFALGNVSPLFDEKGEVRGSVAAFLDISERKKIEQLLRNSERLYRAVVDNLQFGISVINRKMEIVAVNQFVQESHPHATAKCADLCYRVFNDPPRDVVCNDCPCLLTFQDGQVHRIEREFSSQGQNRTVRIASHPVKDEHGKVELVIELLEDITNRKLIQERLSQSQKLEALGTLVGGIAHDFNNMLQCIIGYSEMLLTEKKEGEPGYKDLQTIIEVGEGGSDLVKKLLAFGQQGQAIPTRLDLNNQIKQISTLISRTFSQLIQIELDLTSGAAEILADRGQVDQLLMNLAINASEAMTNGGSLKIATKKMLLDETYCNQHHGVKPGRYVMMMVSDTGRGMDRETMAKVFDPFFSTKQRGSARGTGLGLSVVQGIVQQLGGHVTCESGLGKGTSFKVYFPAIETNLASSKVAGFRGESGKRGTILVVEDSTPIAELEKKFLVDSGFKTILANNGKEALDIYRGAREDISLVILDLLMPEMSGRDCLMELVKIDPAVKVLVASGYAPGDELLEEISPLVRGFVRKPFSMSDFMSSVRSLTGIDQYRDSK